MFGSKGWKEGECVFTSKPSDEYRDIVVGIVTGVEDTKIGVNGIVINPAGLKNKVSQGKAGPQSIEILKNPTPKECILALIYRVEFDNFTGVFDVNTDPVVKIHKNIHNIITGWVKEAQVKALVAALADVNIDEAIKAAPVAVAAPAAAPTTGGAKEEKTEAETPSGKSEEEAMQGLSALFG